MELSVGAMRQRTSVGQRLVDAADETSSHAVETAVGVLAAAGNRPTRTAFAARALRAVAHLVELAPERSLAAATSAQSDYAALLQVLSSPEAIAILQGADAAAPLLPARLAGLQARDHLLRAAGGTFTSQQMATALGLTRQAVDNRRRTGKLLALAFGKRGYRYPAWQVDQGRTVPGLDAVLAELRDLDPWTQLAFVLNPNTWLDDETPLAVLRRGEIDRVREAAAAYGEHVAA